MHLFRCGSRASTHVPNDNSAPACNNEVGHEIPHVVVGPFNLEIVELRDEVTNKEDDDMDIEMEWQRSAYVLKRLFLILYILAFFICFLIFLLL